VTEFRYYAFFATNPTGLIIMNSVQYHISLIEAAPHKDLICEPYIHAIHMSKFRAYGHEGIHTNVYPAYTEVALLVLSEPSNFEVEKRLCCLLGKIGLAGSFAYCHNESHAQTEETGNLQY
jgi:hypothetical protein